MADKSNNTEESRNNKHSENAEGGAQEAAEAQKIDSKYRMILLAAQRSKQLQRGARARVSLDAKKHKPTRVALEEIKKGKVQFHLVKED